MIFFRILTDRPCAPTFIDHSGGPLPERLRLLARWQQDEAGRLSCRWIAASKPPREPGG